VPNRSAPHTVLVSEIRLALGHEPDLLLWPVQPGGVHDVTGRPMRTGPVGMSDLIGILAPHGTWICLEAKTGRAKQTRNQVLWMDLIRSHGGVYAVVRSVDDAKKVIEQARSKVTP